MTRNGLAGLGISGKTAIVSGSGRGVGRSVALALAGAGVNIAINYAKDEMSAASTLEEIRALGVQAFAIRADASDESDAIRLVRETEAVLGGVDILVNNAHGRIVRKPFTDSSWAEHQSQMEGVLKAAFLLSHAVLSGMKARGWGRIVNVGNNMKLQPISGYSAYNSAMSSLTGFTRNLALEAGPSGITVNMVSPGFVLTENAPNTTEKVREAIALATPLRRLAVPDDIARAVLFFCSELSGFVAGADLSVDGGKTMG